MFSTTFDDGKNRPFSPSRRQFVTRIAAASAIAGLHGFPLSSFAASTAGNRNVLSGTQFNLDIGETPVDITGRTIAATTVNGTMPAPLLRWREGDTVTLQVTNEYGHVFHAYTTGLV